MPMNNPMRVDPGTTAAATPAVFAPNVSQSEIPLTPASAGPFVRPMRNSAPGLLQQTGQTLTQAGETEAKIGNTIGDRVQETMDDATTKAAENQLLQTAMPLLSQYRSTEGLNATQQFDPTAQAIVKARQDARSTLTNPIQQQMFDQVTNDHVLNFGQQMAAHENTERVQYGKEQSSARADSMNLLASQAYLHGDMAGYQKYSGQADAETLNTAQLSGQAPDSDAAQAMLRTKRSALAQSVVAGLLDRHAYNEASDYFSKVQDSLDMQTAERLGSSVKSVMHQEAPKDYGDKAIMAASGVKGPGVLQPPIPAATITTTQGVNGVDLHTAQGTQVKAPASGTVTKVWNDEKDGGGLTVEMALPGGYTASFNHLSAANYEAGQKITIGQTLGLSGKDENGQGVVNYSVTDADGKSIDPRQASSAPMDPKNFNTPEQLEKAVDWINSNVSDPEDRFMTERYVRGINDTNRQIATQEHQAALKQATDFWFQNGESLNGLPAQVKMQLTPEDMFGFSKKAEEVAALGQDWYRLGQEAKTRGEVNLLANWDADPASRTVDAVRQAYAQGQLSDESYQSAIKEATTFANRPDKIRQASIDHDQLTDVFAMNQLPNLAQPKSDADKLSRVQMETAIKNEIDVQQQRNNRPLTWQEKGKIARDMVIDKVYTPGFFGAGTPTPVTLLSRDQQQNATVWVGKQKVRMMDIPARYTLDATQDLRANGITPTQANIAAWWLKKGSPKQ